MEYTTQNLFTEYEPFSSGNEINLNTLYNNTPYINMDEYLKYYGYRKNSSTNTNNTENFFNRTGASGELSPDSSVVPAQPSLLSSYTIDPKDANLPLDELLRLEGVHFRVSSHRRSLALNSRFPSGKNSWHVNSDWAWDIVPNGVSWEQFKREIYGNPRIVNWLRIERQVNSRTRRRLGIIDETRPEVMKKTGATGPHLHVGPDTWAVQMFEEYMKTPSMWGGTADMINRINQSSQSQGSHSGSVEQPRSSNGGNYIRINKANKTLTVYDSNNNVLKTYPVSTGINPGNKQRQGDNRTPESKDKPFYIELILDSSSWRHNFNDGRGNIPSYGKWFMRLGGTGFSGIGIHGAGDNDAYIGKTGEGYRYGSEGCIRLRNADIEDLYRYVKVKTPVYINRKGGILKAEGGQTLTINGQEVQDYIPPELFKKINSYGKKFTEKEINRALYTVGYLMHKGGFSKDLAVAQVGIFLDENRCDPSNYMRAEKSRQGAPGTRGYNEYGAGISSLTGETKKEYLRSSGLSPDTTIEDLPLNTQCDLIINASKNGPLSLYYNILRKCNNYDLASSAAYLITAGVGHWQQGNWTTAPTLLAAEQASSRIGQANDRRYRPSTYHSNSFQRRYNIGKTLGDIFDYYIKTNLYNQFFNF